MHAAAPGPMRPRAGPARHRLVVTNGRVAERHVVHTALWRGNGVTWYYKGCEVTWYYRGMGSDSPMGEWGHTDVWGGNGVTWYYRGMGSHSPMGVWGHVVL